MELVQGGSLPMRLSTLLLAALLMPWSPAWGQSVFPSRTSNYTQPDASGPPSPSFQESSASPNQRTVRNPAPQLPDDHLISFETAQTNLVWQEGAWRIVADGKLLKDFGKRQTDSRIALRLIRDLGL